MLSKNGPAVLYEDHEAALADRDARIAELERERDGLTIVAEGENKNHLQAQVELHNLRTAIEAKAAELEEEARRFNGGEESRWRWAVINTLRALEGK